MDALDYMVAKAHEALGEFYEGLDSESQTRYAELLTQFLRFLGEARDAGLLEERTYAHWDYDCDWSDEDEDEDFWF